jgi:hypothetical protein
VFFLQEVSHTQTRQSCKNHKLRKPLVKDNKFHQTQTQTGQGQEKYSVTNGVVMIESVKHGRLCGGWVLGNGESEKAMNWLLFTLFELKNTSTHHICV